MPAVCHRLTRSRSTTIASSTVAAGYSDISTPASDNSDACSAISIATLAPVSSTAARHGQLQRQPGGGRKLALIAAITTTSTLAEMRAKTSGHSLASDRGLVNEHEVQPEG